MSRLYPPNIEGTIPAFTPKGNKIILSVPYSMNKTVSESDYIGLKLILKTVQSNKTIKYADSRDSGYDISYNRNTHIAKFDLSSFDDTLKIGNYYKVQLAYIDTNENTGYYSTVGIVKYTAEVIKYLDNGLKIEGFSQDGNNTARAEYVGHYKQENDPTEKVYQYCFSLYSSNMDTIGDYALVASSGWQLHNSENDTENNESIDKYSFSYSLEPNIPYKVQYKIRTNNLLEEYVEYNVVDKQCIRPEISADLHYEMNTQEAYVKLYLTPYDNEDGRISNNGAFILARSSSEDNFTNWYELQRFTLRPNDDLTNWSFNDFTIEQGITYQYSIQQYNMYGLRSSRLIASGGSDSSTYLTADFEDMFLYDGERQLKIRFNPKVSSFKTTVLEQKQDTIGSKYPFFFRNGKVEYKEFSIAGLLSYWLDEANFFIDDEKLGLTKNPAIDARFMTSADPETAKQQLAAPRYSTGYEDYSITAERKFKLEVLDWLNNGEPKLFKSPYEGNYLVRLMNISLTPEDTTGRLLHTFQAMAYEIDNHSYSSLLEHGIVTINEPSGLQYRLMSVDLAKMSPTFNPHNPDVQSYVVLIHQLEEEIEELEEDIARLNRQIQNYQTYHPTNWQISVQTARHELQQKQSRLIELSRQKSEYEQAINEIRANEATILNKYPIYEYVQFSDILPGTVFTVVYNDQMTDITIGVTGSYTLYLPEIEITELRIINTRFPHNGLITYQYYADEENLFEQIADVTMDNVLARQFIGHKKIIDISANRDMINNIKRNLIAMHYIHFSPRHIEVLQRAEYNSDVYYLYNEKTRTIIDNTPYTNFNELYIYKIYTETGMFLYYASYGPDFWGTYRLSALSGSRTIDYSIKFNNETLYLKPDDEEELLNHLIQGQFGNYKIDYLEIGDGIILDCAYSTSITKYNIELTDDELIQCANSNNLTSESEKANNVNYTTLLKNKL